MKISAQSWVWIIEFHVCLFLYKMYEKFMNRFDVGFVLLIRGQDNFSFDQLKDSKKNDPACSWWMWLRRIELVWTSVSVGTKKKPLWMFSRELFHVFNLPPCLDWEQHRVMNDLLILKLTDLIPRESPQQTLHRKSAELFFPCWSFISAKGDLD